MIHYRNGVRRSGVNATALKRKARAILRSIGQREATLSVSLVSDEEMHELNRIHRGKDRATDVLSFPLATQGDPNGGERLLGDVVISVDTARRQAADYDAPLEAEINRLLIHGVLHVVGYDHEQSDDRSKMRAEERRIAKAIGMPWPYRR
ncbi:MAG: rRNA maturation RNase YbeY [Candidatus Eremiobacteraeota bacterium]|nr:rRNA maturation RNase YbeY [Candidatus Eremiobacteraeota bacterium]